MIYYFDTSAFIPLLLTEPGSPRADTIWSKAEQVVSSQLLYVEAAAALAQAQRMGRLSEDEHAAAVVELDELHDILLVIGVDDRLIRRAAAIATDFGLRGYDAVHCASAERLARDGVVMVSGDIRLLRTCGDLGLGTADTNPPPDGD